MTGEPANNVFKRALWALHRTANNENLPACDRRRKCSLDIIQKLFAGVVRDFRYGFRRVFDLPLSACLRLKLLKVFERILAKSYHRYRIATVLEERELYPLGNASVEQS